MTGEEMIQKADAFIERNPIAWENMKRIAKANVSECRRFSIQLLAEEARFKMPIVGKTDGYRVSNSITAPLARRLLREMPEAEGYITVRRSKCDKCAQSS